jgi:formylglycine-generating enzyme
MIVNVEAEMVVIGMPENPANALTGMGSVDYEFMMGKYEVNNREYATFLNAVATSDPYGLYNASMASSSEGGINRAGSSGAYSYQVKSGFLLKPVNFVSFFDAVRYVNWLQNGANPGADTETGVYELEGGTALPTNASTVTRSPNSDFWIPNENEWSKSAFYHPSALGGDSDNYWEYATGSNQEPSAILPPSAPPAANYRGTRPHEDTEISIIGSYTGSGSYFGTFDQNGNVWEITDDISFSNALGYGRGGTGGGYSNSFVTSSSSYTGGDFWGVDWESGAYGFRIAGSINLNGFGTVNAGSDIAVTPTSYPHTLQLNGSVTSDLTSTWQLISGPLTASIVDVASPTTTVEFAEEGDYVFEITGSDNAKDTAKISILISFTAKIEPIFSNGVGQADCTQCHNQFNALNLSTDNGNSVYNSITATATAAVAGQPEESLLLLKPTLGVPYGKTITHGGGDRTIANPPLTQDHLKALVLWINQGVNNN